MIEWESERKGQTECQSSEINSILVKCDAPQENQANWHRMCMADNNRQAVQTLFVLVDYVQHDFKRTADF